MKKVILLPILFMLLIATDSFAAKRYWIATATQDWNSTSNWSTSATGSGGSTVPSTNDTAYFTSSRTGQCNLNATASVKRFEMGSGCGTFSQGTNTLTIGSTGATLSGGTFTGGSASITVSGAFVISGCAFTSTSGTFSSSANFTFSSGSFTHNGGKMKFTATSTMTGSSNLSQLEYAPAATSTFTIASGTTLTVDSTLSFTGTAAITLNTGTIHAQGPITCSNSSTSGAGTASIVINGTRNQSLTGAGTSGQSRLPNVTINKSLGTLSMSGFITATGNWTYTAGTISTGSSTVVFIGPKTISGSHTLQNVTFTGSGSVSSVATMTIASGTTLTVAGTLVVSGTNGIDLNTGNIHAKGNVTFSNTSNFGGGNAMLTINGNTGNQTFTGNSSENDGRTPNITINKTSDTLKLVSIISCPGSWTYTAGVINSGSSTVYFIGANTINGSHQLNNVTKFVGQPMTLTSGTTLTVQGTFSVKGNNICQINTGTVACKGNITVTNTGTTGNGDGTILISGTGDQTFTGTTTAGQGRLQNITINKPSGTLYLVNHIFCIGNWTYTAGTIDAGASTVHYRLTGMTLSGTHALNNVTFYGDATAITYNISGTLTVNGTLSFNGTGTITMNAGTIHAKGHITTTNTGTSTGGSTTIVINGSGNQTLTGSGTAGAGKFPHITIDKSSGILTLASITSVIGNWNYTNGDVDPSTSTVALYGNFNLDGQVSGGSTCMRFYNLTVGGNTRTLTGNLDVNNNLTISTGTTLSAAAYTINVGGNWNSQGTWTYSTSTVVFDGSSYNTIKGASGAIVNFATVTVNRGPGSVTLQNPMKVNTAMTLTKGRIKTTSAYYLEFADNATCAGGDDAAYVHGPMRKTGNDAFTFPLGDTTLQDTASYHPLRISAPTNITDQYEAEYRNANQTQGSALVDSLTALRGSEFWNLNRTSGSSAVTVTLSWNKNLPPSSISDLRVASWNATTSAWADLGQAAVTLNWPTGTITASSTTIFNTNTAVLTTASTIPKNWGYATLRRKLDGGFYEAKSNALYFRFDDEYNDQNHNLSYSIFNAANTNVAPTLVGSSNNAALSNYGDNRFKLDLWTNTASLSSGYYILEVRNEKEELFYLRFKKS